MKSITQIIAPIKLLAGTHSDTAQTGSGCFMNVIAYLNGEDQITDQSSCVCVTVRPLAILLNDTLTDAERPRMIPFIERAMGSATSDREELNRRCGLVVTLAQNMAKQAQESAKYAAESAECAAKYAAKCAAESAAESAAKLREQRVEMLFKFLDDALSKIPQQSCEFIERAEKLVKTAAGVL